MRRRWIADASPIILLAKTGHLHLLPTRADAFLIPETVAEEVLQGEEDDPARLWMESEERHFIASTDPVTPEVAAWDLGRGENRVLSYAFTHEGRSEAILRAQ